MFCVCNIQEQLLRNRKHIFLIKPPSTLVECDHTNCIFRYKLSRLLWKWDHTESGIFWVPVVHAVVEWSHIVAGFSNLQLNKMLLQFSSIFLVLDYYLVYLVINYFLIFLVLNYHLVFFFWIFIWTLSTELISSIISSALSGYLVFKFWIIN